MTPEMKICQGCPISLTCHPRLSPENKSGRSLSYARSPGTYVKCRHYSCDLPAGGIWAAEDARKTGTLRECFIESQSGIQTIKAVLFGTSQKPGGRIVARDGNIYSSISLFPSAGSADLTYYPTGQSIKSRG